MSNESILTIYLVLCYLGRDNIMSSRNKNDAAPPSSPSKTKEAAAPGAPSKTEDAAVPSPSSKTKDAAASGGNVTGDPSSTPRPSGVYVPSDPDDVILKPPRECPVPRRWTTLTKLENMAEDELPPKNSVLFCRIVKWSKPPAEKQKKLVYNKASGDGKSSQFDRTLVVMDVQSSKGQNTAVVLLRGNQSSNIFCRSLSARDSPDGFLPGSYILIENPLKVTEYYGSLNGLPILTFGTGLVLVDTKKSNIVPKCVPFVESEKRFHTYVLPVVKLEVCNFGVEQTTCIANMCDSIGQMKSPFEWHPTCPCWVKKRLQSDVVFRIVFRVIWARSDGSPTIFFTENFVSRSFTNLVSKEGINMGISKAQLDTDYSSMIIEHKLDKLVAAVNENGGFQVMGWCRYGVAPDANGIKDNAAVGAPSVSLNAGGGAQASKPKYHLVNVKFNCSRDVVKDLLVDVNGIAAGHKKKRVAGEGDGDAGGTDDSELVDC